MEDFFYSIKDIIIGFFSDAKKWSKKKFFLFRSILWLYFLFVFVRLILDPSFQSIFKPLNLGLHEFGHIIFAPFGQLIAMYGGSFFQCFVPIISFFMFFYQKDFFAISVSFCWLAINLYDVSVYIADAQLMQLYLVTPFGGAEVIHDWNFILEKIGQLENTSKIAAFTRFNGFISMLIGLSFGGWLLFNMIYKYVNKKNNNDK